MNAIVVYESAFGNTRAVAKGLGAVAVLPVHDAVSHTERLDLLVVGALTHTDWPPRSAQSGGRARWSARTGQIREVRPLCRVNESISDVVPGRVAARVVFAP